MIMGPCDGAAKRFARRSADFSPQDISLIEKSELRGFTKT